MPMTCEDVGKLKKRAFLRLTFVALLTFFLLILNSMSAARTEQVSIKYIHFVTYDCIEKNTPTKKCVIEGTVDSGSKGLTVKDKDNTIHFLSSNQNPVPSSNPIGYEKYAFINGKMVLIIRQV